MAEDFFHYPHTPHLAWLGRGLPREDKVLSPAEAKSLLEDEVVVEEKLDGANLGFSLASEGRLLAQNRGQYLSEPYAGQFARLPAWLDQHADALLRVLEPNILMFGEWCAARHSLDYVALPDWFLLFDVYDRHAERFWCSSRRNGLAASAGLVTVPEVARGKHTLATLKELIATRSSRYRNGPMEGVVIRRESAQWREAGAKLVRPDFTQAIETHWRKRALEWNRLSYPIIPNDEYTVAHGH